MWMNVPSLQEALINVDLRDFRQRQGRRYELNTIILLSCVAIMRGAATEQEITGWIERDGKRWLKWLGVNGNRGPSAATITRVFAGIETALLEAALIVWARQVIEILRPERLSQWELTATARIETRCQPHGVGRCSSNDTIAFIKQCLEAMSETLLVSFDQRDDRPRGESLLAGLALTSYVESQDLLNYQDINYLPVYTDRLITSVADCGARVPGRFNYLSTDGVNKPLASPNTVGTELFDDNTFVSYAGRLTYDFAKKYLFTAAIRQDESSRFGPNNRKAVFPSFSVGWRLAEEVFLKSALNAAKISELKLRGGYGRTGNANIGSFTYVNAITLNRNYAAGNIRLFGSQQAGFANPDLTWEKNDQVSIGADVGLFGNKLLLTADYFFRTSKGMLLNKALPAIVGYATSYQANLGTLENRGVEFSATTSVNLNQLRWTINANASTYKTKVTDLGGPAALPGVAAINGWNNVYQVKVGQPLGQMYGYTVVGVFKNAGDLAANPQTVSGNKVGDWMIKDQNGDGRIDVNDVTVIGHGLPDFIYGLTNTFQYKNFDLNVLVQGVQGVNIINGNYRQLITGNNNQNTLDIYYNNYFDPVNPNRNVDYPIPASGSSINPTNSLVNKDVENGSYFRVRNITFGYRFSSALLQRAKLTSARLYVTAQNPVLITKYRGYNPEANINTSNPVTPGVDQGTYPVATTYIVGINFGF